MESMTVGVSERDLRLATSLTLIKHLERVLVQEYWDAVIEPSLNSKSGV